ncbi:MAG: hypothetical protein ACO3FE_20310 [Planctomycetaceae bacterium]
MKQKRLIVFIALAGLFFTAAAVAQFGQFGQFGGRRGINYGPDGRVDRRGFPDWKLDIKFKKDVFTFVRIR